MARLRLPALPRYAGDVALPRMCHAVMVQSTVARGRIVSMDIARAEHATGQLAGDDAGQRPVAAAARACGGESASRRVLLLLQDDVVHYHGQPIAVVVADTLEHAVAAAALVRATYAPRRCRVLDFAPRQASGLCAEDRRQGEDTDKQWGDVAAGLQAAEVTVDAVYTTPMETHNPMEPHATVAQWDGDDLTLYDATQYISGVKQIVAKTLGIAADRVRVVSPFVGGGFGCKGSVWSHVVLAAMAARKLRRPVKLVLARPQMFGPVGGRPQTEQHLVIGARRDGRLTAIRHDVISHTSEIEDSTEPSALPTRMLYACPNVSTTPSLDQTKRGNTDLSARAR